VKIANGAQDEYGCPEFDKLWDPEKRPECPNEHLDACHGAQNQTG
jgi:hypothetical protein